MEWTEYIEAGCNEAKCGKDSGGCGNTQQAGYRGGGAGEAGEKVGYSITMVLVERPLRHRFFSPKKIRREKSVLIKRGAR